MSDDSMSDKSQTTEEPACKITEDPKRNFPTFSFSNKMKKRLYRAWSKAVIVKLLDRNIGFKALETRLQTMWAKRGIISRINIGHGYFVVKLSNKDDYSHALTGGPWMIYDHYLTVQPWVPQFRPDKAIIDKVAVWVRVPRVSLEYYDEEALTVIGNRIGRTLKVDMNTSHQLRGHFARICVLVELGNQLMSGFSLDGEDYYIEYEGLHLLCTSCGVYGHKNETCPSRKACSAPASDVQNEQVNVEGEQGMNSSDMNQESWKVVQKPQRQRKSKEKQGEGFREVKRGTRFDILAEVEDANIVVDNDNRVFKEETERNDTIRMRSKSQRKTKTGKHMGTRGAAKEVEQRALNESVQKGNNSRRVEKRMRAMSVDGGRNKDGGQRITMGEGNDHGTELGMEVDGTTDGGATMAVQTLHTTQTLHMSVDDPIEHLPIDPSERRDEELDPGDIQNEMGCVCPSPTTSVSLMEAQCMDTVVPETQ